MTNKIYDLIIIGAGPAGVTAGIYASSDKINFLLFSGGRELKQMENSINSHYFVNGFPGTTEKTTGTDLKNNFLKHYQRLGGEFTKENVISLTEEKGRFLVETNREVYYCLTVLISSGTSPKNLIAEGMDEYGKKIYYDSQTYKGECKNMNILVVGGRNSGAVAACYLADKGANVTLIEIEKEIQAKEKYKKWLKRKKVKIITNAKINRVLGDKEIEKVEINKGGKIITIKIDLIFPFIGRKPNLNFLKINVKKDEQGFLFTDRHNETSVKGLFAAGDITGKINQIVTSCGDGANAYYFSRKHLDNS